MTSIKEVVQKSQLPQLEAKILLAHVLQESKVFLITHETDLLTDEQLQQFKEFSDRRLQGEPIAYITQQKEFYGRSFMVSAAVLIPRPETEQIIEVVLAENKNQPIISCMDVGAGSGCIGITLASELPNCQITALEISPEAIEIAKYNAEQLHIQKNYTLQQSDLLDVLKPDVQYDCIVANLPYIDPADPDLATDVAQYEPSLALFSAEAGLSHYRQLFEQLCAKRISYRCIICEVGHEQKELMTTLIQKTLGKTPTWRYDLSEKPRICIIK